MRGLAILFVLGALASCGMSAADGPRFRLDGARTATAGAAWTARLVVTPASAGRPSVVALRGSSRRTAAIARTGPGRYRARLVFPAAGRWSLQGGSAAGRSRSAR